MTNEELEENLVELAEQSMSSSLILGAVVSVLTARERAEVLDVLDIMHRQFESENERSEDEADQMIVRAFSKATDFIRRVVQPISNVRE